MTIYYISILNTINALHVGLHFVMKFNKINFTKPAHNRTKHDATAQYDDNDDNSVLQCINLIKDGDLASIYIC